MILSPLLSSDTRNLALPARYPPATTLAPLAPDHLDNDLTLNLLLQSRWKLCVSYTHSTTPLQIQNPTSRLNTRFPRTAA